MNLKACVSVLTPCNDTKRNYSKNDVTKFKRHQQRRIMTETSAKQ